MDVNNKSQRSSISKANSYKEIGEYWDTHSLADHWDDTSDVEFEVAAKRRHRVAVDSEIYDRLEVEARTRGVGLETLVNILLTERLGSHSTK
jgi:hypothetical protein